MAIYLWQFLMVLAALTAASTSSWGAKTNQAVYEEPFDSAAGGASLTRATQEGIIFANPAQLPYGGKFLRWIGLKNTLIVGKDSREFVQDIKNNSADTSATGIVNAIFDHPLHAGLQSALSVITQNIAVSAFARVEPDLSAQRFGKVGTPEIRFRGEAYGGLAASYGLVTPWRWLSVGMTAKELYVSEPDISLDLADQEGIKKLQTSEGIADQITPVSGLGFDAGILAFAQGKHLDFRLALKADDVGGTSFGASKTFKQTAHVGLGLTFHSDKDALHLAADYRDIQGVYGESPFKRVYVGAKALARGMFGVACGYYQGYPTAGVVLDLLFVRASLTFYTRELGEHPGVDPRSIYLLSFAMGF